MHTGNFWKERNTGIHSLIEESMFRVASAGLAEFCGVVGFLFLFFFL